MTDISNPIFHDEDKARAYLEAQRWPGGPFCPLCGQLDTVKALPPKGSMGKGWYHCRECRRKFTVRTGTLYERSHVPLHKWLMATHLLCASKKGMSAHQLHRMLGVTYKTAWFMAHRIREGMREGPMDPMGGNGGTVEIDETFYGRDASKKKNVGYQHKHKVLALVDRDSRRVRSMVVEKLTVKDVTPILVTNVAREAQVMTDQAGYYRQLGDHFAKHGTVNHEIGEYARGAIHTNTIEGYFSIFKRGMKGVYQHCAKKHLHRYLAEFDFRYSHRDVEDRERADIALKGIQGKRLTYRRTGEGEARA